MSCVTHHHACECREARFAHLKSLLVEAFEWLCDHEENGEVYWRKGGGRQWCPKCRNFLRSDAEFTLKERVKAALEKEE